ncbi:MAG: hypothetical protein JW786_15005 [Desulfobacterales bacterium]|nr:hypothetical protein [Desulfobacterales bacterium]
MWYFETRIGVFQIYAKSEQPEKYQLYIDNIHLADYDSPEAAADDVFKRSTGWDEWDFLSSEEPPVDLMAWSEGKPFKE